VEWIKLFSGVIIKRILENDEELYEAVGLNKNKLARGNIHFWNSICFLRKQLTNNKVK